MTSFGWKRKSAATVKTNKLVNAFDECEQVEPVQDTAFNWIDEAKRRKIVALEDNQIRFDRLKQEGSLLAEQGRFWEAISRWNDCLLINGEDAAVLEMKSQALIQVHEWLPAIECAEKATEIKNNWWPGFQTLGRAQLGIGEVKLALRNFQVAFHLNPAQSEIWSEDILWARHLMSKASLATESQAQSADTFQRIKPDSLQICMRN